MSIRLVRTPFAVRDGSHHALHSVDTNVPSSSTTRNGPAKPRGPRKAYSGFKGGALSSPLAPVSPIRELPSTSPSFPKRTSTSHRRTSPYADAYPGKARTPKPTQRPAFEAVAEEDEADSETQQSAGSHARQYASITHRPVASLYKPLPSGRSVLERDSQTIHVDYSKQVAELLLNRVSEGRIPRLMSHGTRSYVKSGLSRVAASL